MRAGKTLDCGGKEQRSVRGRGAEIRDSYKARVDISRAMLRQFDVGENTDFSAIDFPSRSKSNQSCLLMK